jgi:hypothetical protein
MSNLYRGPSIDASYQVLVHLAKRFQRRKFVEIDQSETRIACVLVSDWLIFFNSSPLKPFGQMNRNLVGSIYGRSSIKIANFKLALPLARLANNKKTFILGYHKEKNSIDKQQNFTSN